MRVPNLPRVLDRLFGPGPRPAGAPKEPLPDVPAELLVWLEREFRPPTLSPSLSRDESMFLGGQQEVLRRLRELADIRELEPETVTLDLEV